METIATRSSKAIMTFLLITLALSSIFYFLIIRAGKLESGHGLFVLGLMWCPGVAALISLKILNRKLAGIGWRWGKTRYQLWSFLVPLLYTLIAYLIIWIAGWGAFYNNDFVSQIAKKFGWENMPVTTIMLLFFAITTLVGMTSNVLAALGEEIGWRGFLAPELFKLTNYTKTSLITGIIWAVWHYPILIFADYNSGTPAWYGLSCFTVMVVADSFILVWFRLKSGSV